jgi:hypothetical protein
MFMTVFRNGKPLDEDDFADVDESKRAAAMRAFHERTRVETGGSCLSGGNLAFGTPRKGKNTKFTIRGIRVQ